jgi:hypothetical protein
MTETRFNLIFDGKLEPDQDQDVVRSTLESLFEFDTESPFDFFNGHPVILGENMNVTTARLFKQALADAGVATHLLTANDSVATEELQSRSLADRRQNTNRRARIRRSAILPDRREGLDRRP